MFPSFKTALLVTGCVAISLSLICYLISDKVKQQETQIDIASDLDESSKIFKDVLSDESEDEEIK